MRWGHDQDRFWPKLRMPTLKLELVAYAGCASIPLETRTHAKIRGSAKWSSHRFLLERSTDRRLTRRAGQGFDGVPASPLHPEARRVSDQHDEHR